MAGGEPADLLGSGEDLLDWLLESKPDDFDVTIITTYPGTPYYDRAVQHPTMKNVWVYTYPETGDRLYGYEVDYTVVSDYYKGDPDGGYKAYVYTNFAVFLFLINKLAGKDFRELLVSRHTDVRKALDIPFNAGRPAQRFEHSMGQLPSTILRATSHAAAGG